MPVHVADRPLNCSSPRDREKDWEKEMILTRLTLSACLVVGTMASMSVPVAAASPTGISGLNNNGNIHLIGERGGRQAGRGAGHRGAGHVGRGAGHRGTGYLGRGAGHRGAGHIGRGAGHRGAGHIGRGAGHRGTGYLGRGAGHRGAGHIGHGGGHGRRGHNGSFIAGAIVGGLLGWNAGYGYPRAQYQRYRQYHHSSYAGGSGCHPVNKFGIWRGRPAKVGGTMCYNRNGQGYIVSGSRYLIHYR